MLQLKSVCIYCGSATGTLAAYEAAAVALGQELVTRELQLVYGGGNIGLMGIVADTVMAAGGTVTGVIPSGLMEKEIGHLGLTDLHIVDDMHERKALMANLSDAFVAMPGGWGTLEEIFEALTWLQLGIHQKPCAVFNAAGYYDQLLAFLQHAHDSGFVKEKHHRLLIQADNPVSLLDQMAEFRLP